MAKKQTRKTTETERLEKLEVAKQLGLTAAQVKFVLDYLLHDVDGAVMCNKQVAAIKGKKLNKVFSFKKLTHGNFMRVEVIKFSTLTGLETKGILTTKEYGNGRYTLYQLAEAVRLDEEDKKPLETFLQAQLIGPRLSEEMLNLYASCYDCSIKLDRRISAFQFTMDNGQQLENPFADETLYGRILRITDIDGYQWIEVIEQTLKNNGIEIDPEKSLFNEL